MSVRWPEPVTVQLDYCEWVVIMTLLRNEYSGGNSSAVDKVINQIKEYNK